MGSEGVHSSRISHFQECSMMITRLVYSRCQTSSLRTNVESAGKRAKSPSQRVSSSTCIFPLVTCSALSMAATPACELNTSLGCGSIGECKYRLACLSHSQKPKYKDAFLKQTEAQVESDRFQERTTHPSDLLDRRQQHSKIHQS